MNRIDREIAFDAKTYQEKITETGTLRHRQGSSFSNTSAVIPRRGAGLVAEQASLLFHPEGDCDDPTWPNSVYFKQNGEPGENKTYDDDIVVLGKFSFVCFLAFKTRRSIVACLFTHMQVFTAFKNDWLSTSSKSCSFTTTMCWFAQEPGRTTFTTSSKKTNWQPRTRFCSKLGTSTLSCLQIELVATIVTDSH